MSCGQRAGPGDKGQRPIRARLARLSPGAARPEGLSTNPQAVRGEMVDVTVCQSRRPTPVKLLVRRVKYLAKGGNDEGLLGFDCITPLKPHLGASYQRLTGLLQAAIAARYDVPAWSQEDYLLHKRADRLAAISEAAHVAGWSLADIHEEFGTTTILMDDPLQEVTASLQPWEPWPPALAARLFLERLRGILAAAVSETALAALAAAYAIASERVRRRCAAPVHGTASLDLLVRAEAPDGEAWEGVVVAGEREADGAWALDAEFLIFTTDERPEGQLVTVHGWNCDVQPL